MPLFGQSFENRRIRANQQRLLDEAKRQEIAVQVKTITADHIKELEPGQTFSLAAVTKLIQSRLKNLGVAAPNANRQKIQRLLDASPHIEPLPKPANWTRQIGSLFKKLPD